MRADSGSAILSAIDLRREPRIPAEGTVQLTLPGRTWDSVEGSLIDVSASGFRASHFCIELESGSVVRFRHTQGHGLARVVWNRIVGQAVESGFSVLDRSGRDR